MENKFRNEKEIKLGDVKILLRPTFENIAAMESAIGGVPYLGWKFSRGLRIDADGKAIVTEASIKALPSLSECAQIIYFNQAAHKPEDPTQKKYSLEEIWELVVAQGPVVSKTVTEYIAGLMASGPGTEKTVPVEEKKT